MTIQCSECGSYSFRISRFRLMDLNRLFVLKYPIRCRSCYQRIHAPVAEVLKVGANQRSRQKSDNRS